MQIKRKFKSMIKTASGLALLGATTIVSAGGFRPAGADSGTGNLANRLDIIINYFGNFIYFVYALALLTGVIFLFSGINGWKKENDKGEHGNPEYGKPMGKVLASILLLGFTFWVSVMYETSTATTEQEVQNKNEF